MQVGIIGISHFSSSLSLREKIAKVCREQFSHRLTKLSVSHVLLSTCNRTEIYFSSPDLTEVHGEILQTLRESMHEPFDQALYSYFGADCFLHLGRVISGMDSLIFGESDIQRQVKIAYESVRKENSLPPSLHYLFQKGLRIGKQMRTAVLPTHANLPATIFTLLECLKNACKDRRVLFIGNSAINRGMIAYFLRKGCKDLTLCTRSEKVPFPSIKLEGWESLDNWFDYDVVIAGTYHHEYILKRSRVLEDLKSQTVLFDLGVPRNIDPGLKCHPLLHLYNIDELSQMTNRAKKTSEKEIQLCETMVEKAVERQVELFHLKQQARWRYVAPCEKLAILP